jgi:ADP-heptose:LPS heptosyltransferase
VKILAIRFARLGDVVLLLPALATLKQSFPGSRLTFLTGHRCAPLAELCPAIDEVLAVDRVAMRDGPVWRAIADMSRVVKDVRSRKFDLVVDFHSFRETNLLAWISGAPARVAMKRYAAPYLRFCFNRPPVLEDKSLHVAQMFRKVVEEVAGAPALPAPSRLAVPPGLRQWAKEVVPEGPRITLYIDAPVSERVWPPERFAQVADFVIETFDAAVLVISGSSGSGLAKRVRQASRHPIRLSLFTDVSVLEVAALIDASRLLISNDTGPMHFGPVVGVLTLGLFSVGYPEHFRPAGPNDRFLRANPIEKIQVSDVIETVEQMWATADPDLRR